jgi:hypothetical protein
MGKVRVDPYSFTHTHWPDPTREYELPLLICATPNSNRIKKRGFGGNASKHTVRSSPFINLVCTSLIGRAAGGGTWPVENKWPLLMAKSVN